MAVGLLGLLPLRRGLPADVRRRGAVRRRDHPPAALARGLRRDRQADRRHRQRRHRRHPRAEPGARRRARHDAAAHAELHPVAARPRPAGAVAAQQAARDGRLSDRALEERAGLHAAVPVQPPPSRGGAQAHPPADRQAAAGGLRPRHALQPAVRPVGPAAVPGARRRPVPQPPPRGRLDRHRADRARSTRRASSWSRASGWTPTSSSPPPGSTCSHGRHVAQPGRRAGRPVGDGVLQGDDDLRRPQLHDGDRLHERLLDAEGRPGQPLRLPADQPPRRRGLRVGHAGGARRRAPTCRSSTSRPATSSAASTTCPSRGGARRGACTRTTSATCS